MRENEILSLVTASQKSEGAYEEVESQIEDGHARVNKALQILIEALDAAYVDVVQNVFPEVTTGDTAPIMELELGKALANHIRGWLFWNHPTLQDEAGEDE